MLVYYNDVEPSEPTDIQVTLTEEPQPGKPGLLSASVTEHSSIRHLCPVDGLIRAKDDSKAALFERTIKPILEEDLWHGRNVTVLMNGDPAPNISSIDYVERIGQYLLEGMEWRTIPNVLSLKLTAGVLLVAHDAVYDATSVADSIQQSSSMMIPPRMMRRSSSSSSRAEAATPPPPPPMSLGEHTFRSRRIGNDTELAALLRSMQQNVGHREASSMSVLVQFVLTQCSEANPERVSNIFVVHRRQHSANSAEHYQEAVSAIAHHRLHGPTSSRPSHRRATSFGDDEPGSLSGSNSRSQSGRGQLRPPLPNNPSSPVLQARFGRIMDEATKLLTAIALNKEQRQVIMIESVLRDLAIERLDLVAAGKASREATELGNATKDVKDVTQEYLGKARGLKDLIKKESIAFERLQDEEEQLQRRKKELEIAKEMVEKRHSIAAVPVGLNSPTGGAPSWDGSAMLSFNEDDDMESSVAESFGTDDTIQMPGEDEIEEAIAAKEEELFQYEQAAEERRKVLRAQVANAEAAWRIVSNASLGIRKEIGGIRTQLQHRSYSAYRSRVALQQRLETEVTKLQQPYFEKELNSSRAVQTLRESIIAAELEKEVEDAKRKEESIVGGDEAARSTSSRVNRVRKLRFLGSGDTAKGKTSGRKSTTTGAGILNQSSILATANNSSFTSESSVLSPLLMGSRANTESARRALLEESQLSVTKVEDLTVHFDQHRRELQQKIAEEEREVQQLKVGLNHARVTADTATGNYHEILAAMEEFSASMRAVVKCHDRQPGTHVHFSQEWLKMPPAPPASKLRSQALKGAKRAAADAGVSIEHVPIPISFFSYSNQGKKATPMRDESSFMGLDDEE